MFQLGSTEKLCSKCRRVLPLEDFHKDKNRRSGRTSQCKACSYTRKLFLTDEDRIERRKARAKRRLAREKSERAIRRAERLLEAERTRERRQEEARKRRNELRRLDRLSNPEKHRARRFLNHAVRDGRAFRQPCVVCGDPKVEGHHKDYSRPLDVIWVCAKHHREMFHSLNHPNGKMEASDIPEILRLQGLGLSYRQIGAVFGVHAGTIGRALKVYGVTSATSVASA